MAKHGIRSKITRVFITQVLLISVATIAGVYGSARVVENVLVKKALESEAEHFWERYQQDQNIAEPDTANLLGYLAVDGDYAAVPEELKNVAVGYGRVNLEGQTPIVHISDFADARLFLVFNEEQVSNLAFYFGVVPLAVVLLILYLLAWLGYRQSHRVISPIIQLAKLVGSFDFKNQKLEELALDSLKQSADTEVLTMIRALQEFTRRLQDYIDREQQFTRDASHELRTPLAVIKGSVDLLKKSQTMEQQDREAINRIQRTCRDMESLVETLLMLAREENNQLPIDSILLNDLLQELIKTFQLLYADKPIRIEVISHSLLELQAPEKVLNILFSNLIRNAFNYTQKGNIRIIVKDKQVLVEDTGLGMNAAELKFAFESFYRGETAAEGYGLGLAIVKRLCDRFSWKIKIDSVPQQGTVVIVEFPNARIVGQRAVQ